ncbi:MAG: hypothetical protein II267_02255 [Paludibacteraceae bacterium]|nr:hypothetical protein [Paludibacteraceae bacterium]
MKKITLLLMVAIAAINISAATIEIPEEAKAWNIPAEAIDVLQAREICAGLEADVPTTENYYVMGYVKRVSSKNAETVSEWGQARFYLENVKGANSEEEFDAYQVYGLNGVKINNPDVVAAGDFVVLYGPLTKHQYEGGDVAYQTPGKGAAYIWNSTNPKLHNDTGTTPDTPETPEEPEAKVVTVAEFNAAPEATDVYYELTGTIGGTINTTYGNFDLTDETGTVYVYGLTKAFIAVGSTQNDKSYSSLGLKEGDKITIRGFRGSYNGKIEVMGAYFVKLVEAGSGTTPPTPPVGDLVGDGTVDNPYTVEDVIALNNTSKGPHYVKGFIIGQVNGASIKGGLDTEAPFVGSTNSDGTVATQGTNLMIASVAGDTTTIVPVALPKGELRDAFNLIDHPEMLGVEVLICGSLEKYFGVPGIKSPTSIEVIGGGDPNVVNVKGLQYADAHYYEEDAVGYFEIDMYADSDPDTYETVYPELYVAIQANSKTALNGTYDLLYACLWTSASDSIEMGEELGTVTIKNVDAENNYSFKGSFVGTDGKTYNFNDVMFVYGDDNGDEIVFVEESTDTIPDTPVTPPTPPTEGAIVFDADVDKGNATESQAAYEVSKDGVTIAVSSGRLGTFNNEVHYRIYKNQTLTLTSTVGNIAKVEFTCTAEGEALYGPGCFTVEGGDYTYSGAVGTWTGDAATVTFTASANQVRASQVVVTLKTTATGVEDVVTVEVPVKIFENGQLMVIRGENVYNVLGAQVK